MQGQEELGPRIIQQLEALLSAMAKEFIPRQLFVYFKGLQKFTGFFPMMIGFVTLSHLLFIEDYAKKLAKGDKANHRWENTL